MSLRLCIECGARLPRAAAKVPCAACGAAPPAWKAAPVTLKSVAARLAGTVFYSALGALMLATAFILCTGWGFPSWPGRVAQVLVAAVVVIFGGLTGLAMLHTAVTHLFERRWTHDQGGRTGSARTVLGHVTEASGQATRSGVYAPGVPGLSAVAIFNNMRVLGGLIGTALGAATPKAVDVAVTMALLGLASRGRCELVVSTTRSWEHPLLARLGRRPEQHTVAVRRTARGRALPLPRGYLEAALLAALDAFAVSAPAVGAAPLGPYRQGPADEVPATLGPAVSLDMLMAALTGRRPKARGWLRAALREEARRDPGESRLSAEQAQALAAALAPLFVRGAGGSFPPAAALLFQVSHGLSRSNPATPHL